MAFICKSDPQMVEIVIIANYRIEITFGRLVRNSCEPSTLILTNGFRFRPGDNVCMVFWNSEAAVSESLPSGFTSCDQTGKSSLACDHRQVEDHH